MDDHRFDRVTRAFAVGTSRRKILGLIAAGMFAAPHSRPAAAAQATTCQPGQTDCGGVCVETCCDNANCGACGNVCSGGETCFEGICGCPSGLCCAEGETICGGVCVATCCDNNNCGACGNVCSGGLTCFEGKCDCPSGLCLPNTGQGSSAMPDKSVWTALAVGSVAAAIAAVWQRRPGTGSSDR